jgi:hypothetical protein
VLSRRRLLAAGSVLAAGVAVGCSSGSSSGSKAAPAPADPAEAARQAFFAGYPLVVTTRTLQTFAGLVGVNRLYVAAKLSDPSSQYVVAPNRDTVYAIAVLDLRAGPQIVTLPAIPDRYHVLQFLDAWMGAFALLGTRASQGRGGRWAVVPPGWEGTLPAGVERLDCPTNQAFLLGRIRAVDDADAAAASAIGRRVRLVPLDPSAPAVPAMPQPAGKPQAIADAGAAYWDELDAALAINPAVTADQRAALRALPADPGARSQGLEDGLAALAGAKGAGTRTVNGWNVNLGLGRSDDHQTLEERAVVARWFWGPVPAEEAVYPRAVGDADGRSLDGAHRYRVRFPAGGLPPVDGFWSLTVYGPDMFLVANDAGRYSISGDTPGLVTSADGSVDVHLGATPPPEGPANWLPTPTGPFNVIMRLYLPRRPILDGTYDYPPLTREG